MPPTTPIAGYRALFGRDPATGEVFQVGSSSEIESINDLIDVDTGTTGPTGGQVLVWDETLSQWVPGSQANALNDLSDVTTSATGPTGPTGPTDGQVLLWDAALGQWIPGAQANSIDDLTDVDTSTTGPTGGDGLVWDETVSQWVPGSPISSLDGLIDVDTSTTGPVDKDALVWSASGNQWVPGARSIDDLWDVNTVVAGATGPTGPAHGQMLAWDATVEQWVPGPGASEVEIAATLPTGPDWELWVDETPIAAPGGAPSIPPKLDELADVDTGTTGPVDRDPLVWDEAAGLWVPGALAIDNLTDVDTTTAAPVAGNLLEFDGTNWVPFADPTETLTMPVEAPMFTGTLTIRQNSKTVTIYGTVTSGGTGVPTGGYWIIAGWPAGFTPPPKYSQMTRTYDGGTGISYTPTGHYDVLISTDWNGLIVNCFTGQNWPPGRKADITITYAR